MKIVPLPMDEPDRMAALDALDVLDSPHEREFDDLVVTASLVCATPISLISLIDSDRQWLKANVGLAGLDEIPRNFSFCSHTILGDDVFEVENALSDPRFCDNPFVTGEPRVRFYAGAPIILKNGARVGALCVMNTVPSELSSTQNQVLSRLASVAARALETRQAEIDLQQERKKQQEILDGTGAGTWSWDMKTGRIDVNEQWARMLGNELDEVQESSIHMWMGKVHPDDVTALQKAMDGHVSGEFPLYECEYRIRHVNGNWVWIQARGRVVSRNSMGRPMRISGIHLDITEKRLAIEASKQASNDLRNMLDTLPCLVAYWDDQLINHFANKIYSDYFRLPLDRIYGHHISEVLGQSLYEKNLPHMKLALQGQEQNFERVIPNAHGEDWHTLAKYVPNWVKGEVCGFYAFVFDISEIKRTQNQLATLNDQLKQQALEAQAGSASKSAFLANMSHEIRTPMNAILGLLDLMQRTDLTTQQQDYATKTEGAARSLLGLLNDILDFSKAEAGKMTLEHEPFRIDALLRNLSTILSVNVGYKDIEVLFDVDFGLPEVVLGDQMRLQQILINLGGNAVKFTSKGQVVLSLEKVSQTDTTVAIEFSMKDTGIGIAKENQDRIFNGFSQAEDSTTRRFGGTGLGLAISKRLIELMGGQIQNRQRTRCRQQLFVHPAHGNRRADRRSCH